MTSCGRIYLQYMKKFLALFTDDKKIRKHALSDKEALIIRQGREQFKKLVDRGLTIPVVLL